MRRTTDVKVRYEDLKIEVIEFDEVSTFAYRPTNCTQKRTLWASKRALSVRVCVQSHQLYAEKDAFDLGMGPKRPNVRTVPPVYASLVTLPIDASGTTTTGGYELPPADVPRPRPCPCFAGAPILHVVELFPNSASDNLRRPADPMRRPMRSVRITSVARGRCTRPGKVGGADMPRFSLNRGLSYSVVNAGAPQKCSPTVMPSGSTSVPLTRRMRSEYCLYNPRIIIARMAARPFPHGTGKGALVRTGERGRKCGPAKPGARKQPTPRKTMHTLDAVWYRADGSGPGQPPDPLRRARLSCVGHIGRQISFHGNVEGGWARGASSIPHASIWPASRRTAAQSSTPSTSCARSGNCRYAGTCRGEGHVLPGAQAPRAGHHQHHAHGIFARVWRPCTIFARARGLPCTILAWVLAAVYDFLPPGTLPCTKASDIRTRRGCWETKIVHGGHVRQHQKAGTCGHVRRLKMF